MSSSLTAEEEDTRQTHTPQTVSARSTHDFAKATKSETDRVTGVESTVTLHQPLPSASTVKDKDTGKLGLGIQQALAFIRQPTSQRGPSTGLSPLGRAGDVGLWRQSVGRRLESIRDEPQSSFIPCQPADFFQLDQQTTHFQSFQRKRSETDEQRHTVNPYNKSYKNNKDKILQQVLQPKGSVVS